MVYQDAVLVAAEHIQMAIDHLNTAEGLLREAHAAKWADRPMALAANCKYLADELRDSTCAHGAAHAPF